MKLAGVVILYHPDADVAKHIQTYVSELQCLYVIDNTERGGHEDIKKICESKIQYIAFQQNKGIAYALNYAIKLLPGKNWYLLTMDQDSYFEMGAMKTYRELVADQITRDPSIAMFTTRYTGQKVGESSIYVDRAITSGSIINVDVARKMHGFDENLFIDEVDHEYCYRVRRAGYKIYRDGDIVLQHQLGKPISWHFMGKSRYVSSHNAIRQYYITRNTLYVMRKYPSIRIKYGVRMAKDVIRILLIEDQKIDKFKAMIDGIKDFICGRMGAKRT